MSGTGETLADFVKGLYQMVGCLIFVILVLIGVVVWLVARG